jgi:hypothetical protein
MYELKIPGFTITVNPDVAEAVVEAPVEAPVEESTEVPTEVPSNETQAAADVAEVTS